MSASVVVPETKKTKSLKWENNKIYNPQFGSVTTIERCQFVIVCCENRKTIACRGQPLLANIRNNNVTKIVDRSCEFLNTIEQRLII